MSWPESIRGGDFLTGEVVVKNIGRFDADEVNSNNHFFLILQLFIILM